MRRPGITDAGRLYFLSSVMVITAGFGGAFLKRLGCTNVVLYEFYAIAMASFMLLPAMALDRQGAWLGLERPQIPTMALAAAAAVAAAFMLAQLGNIQYILLTRAGYTPQAAAIPKSNGFEIAAFAFYTVVMAAVCEEIVMRGAVLRAFERGGSWKAIIASAALFALLHGSVESLIQSFLAGIMLGIAAVATKSVITSVVMHMCYNATVIAMSFMSPEWQSALFRPSLTYSAASALVMTMITSALMAGIMHMGKGEFVRGDKSPAPASAIIFLAAGAATMLCVIALNFVVGISSL